MSADSLQGCPVCGSSEVTGDSWEMCAASAQSWQEVCCDDCGSSWDDVYRFSHRENVRHGSRVGIALARAGAGRAADRSTDWLDMAYEDRNGGAL